MTGRALAGVAVGAGVIAVAVATVAPAGTPGAPRSQGAAMDQAMLVVVNKSDDSVSLIDVATGATKARIAVGFAPHEVSASPERTQVAVSNYGTAEKPGSTLSVVDLGSRSLARTIDLGSHTRPHGLAWFARDRLAVTSEGSGHLLVVDPLRGAIVGAVATGQETSHQVAVQPGGRRAFVANIRSGSVTVIDLAAMRKLADIQTGEGAEGIAVRPDGKEVWVGNRAAHTVSVIDAESLAVLATIPVPGFPIRVAFTPDGRRALVSCAVSGEVVLLDVAPRREVLRKFLDVAPVPQAKDRAFSRLAPGKAVPVGLLVTPDGRSAITALTMADALVVLDTARLEITRTIAAGGEPDGMALIPAK